MDNLPVFIFDFGNVLVSWDPRFLYSKLFDSTEKVENFLNEVGFDAWNLEQDLGRPFEAGVRELCDRFPQYCDLIHAYHERWEESLGGPIEPTVAILERLRTAGYPLYGLSNWSAEKFNQIRFRYPFFGWFDAIVLSGEERFAKPDPRLFEIVLEKIGKPAEHCIFIDDSAHNIDAARRLGLRTIHFKSAPQLEEELVALALLGPGQT